MAEITLNIARARISSSKCCAPSCDVALPANLHRISEEMRYNIMKSQRFFIPKNARVCNVHSNCAVWPEIPIPNGEYRFTAVQIEEMVDLLRSPKPLKNPVLADQTFDFRTDTGLTKDQFEDLLRRLPSLSKELGNDIAFDSLYTYLMKMRTGRTNDDIGAKFNITRFGVTKRMNKVRNAMEEDFVFKNVNFMNTREELAQHTTQFSQMLFCNGENRPVLVFDGTYIWCQKSSNFEFQKLSYSAQKKRNFVRVMVCTTTDGTIISVLGPYPASTNDANVLTSISNNSTTLDNLQQGDVIILDRGFRDCVPSLEQRGFVVKTPDFLGPAKNMPRKQFTTEEANRTRLVTANRYCVETRNGHFRTIFKIFQKEWCNVTLPHLMKDISICAALINVYFKSVESNKGRSVEIATLMLNRLHTPNYLSTIVSSNAFQRSLRTFVQFYDFYGLPELNTDDLLTIALGTYQIRMAPSYCQKHLNANNSEFAVFACPDDTTTTLLEDFFSGENQLKLLMIRMKSRFRSNVTHDVYVLIDAMGDGAASVLAYCCECQNGLRTVGACSHVICLIWVTLHMKDINNLPKPAGFLDGFFDEEFPDDEEYLSD